MQKRSFLPIRLPLGVPRHAAFCAKTDALLFLGRALSCAAALTLLLLIPRNGVAQAEPPAPAIVTDQPHYSPGDAALTSGTGFLPGEIVILQLWHLNGTPATGANDGPWQVMADSSGDFSGSWLVCEEDCVGTTVRLTATGQSSGLAAETTFVVQAFPSTFVVTDRSDYPPGSTAFINGGGFQPGENVVLQVLHADGTASTGEDHAPWSVVADVNGAFQSTWHVCADDCVGSTLLLSAVGQASSLAAYAFFTDAYPNEGEVDLSFDAGSAVNDLVYSVALQPDGKVLIGGLFTIVNGAVRSKIARLNPDGSTDLTFQNGMMGVSGEVYSVVLQPDGKALIGGLFTMVNGVPCSSLARLNADGSLDTTFVSTLGLSSPAVHSIAVQPDGKVLIGGRFSTVNGVARGSIARLNSDGSLDISFQNGMAGANLTVRSVVLQPDGNVLMGGQFTTVNGATRNRIARLYSDGTLDTSFQNGMVGANSDVYSVALQPDGRVLIGGAFSGVNGPTRGRIARLNTDGSLDTTFLQSMPGAINHVLSVVVQPDGRVLIGGTFTTVNGVTRNRIARLNSNGSLDTSFLNGMTGAAGLGVLSVASVALQPDGQVLIGGQFTTVNDIGRFRLARLNSDGSLDTTFQNGPPGPDGGNPNTVHAIAVQSDGKVLIGGRFSTVNGVARSSLARLNSNGSLDIDFLNGLAGPAGTGNVEVNCVAVQPDGKVLIGGRFSTVNGAARGSLARLNSDGNLDTTFLNGMAGVSLTATPVLSIAVQPDGKVLVGGLFTTVNGVARTNIARLNSDGSLDVTFQSGTAGATPTVASVVLQSDGKVLIGGSFSLVNGVARRRVARLHSDGSLDTTFLNGLAGANASVSAVAVQSDGQVLIGGSFTLINGVTRTRVARLNIDGSLDIAFQDGMPGANNTVNAVAEQSDGKILLGGLFSLVNDVARGCMARLNSDGSLDTDFLNGLAGVNSSAAVESIVLQPDGNVLIGGDFVTVNDEVRGRVARLVGMRADTTPPMLSCPADQIVSTAPSQCSALVNYPAPTASDESSAVTVSCTPASGSTFLKGTTTVNCTATDASGNTANCSFTVRVDDTEAPSITCPEPIAVDTAPGVCEATVTYTATATDNCPDGTGSCVPPSGSSFPKGTTSVNCTATDASGNSATCSFTVTVNDTEPPIPMCAAPITASTAPGACDAVVTYTAVAYDNCPSASISCVPASGSTFPKGTTTVDCTASDTSGNSATCSFTVTVNDTELPTIICPPNICVASDAGVCSATGVSLGVPVSSDNCEVASVVNDAPASFPLGQTLVTWTVVDGSGNVAVGTQTVTVIASVSITWYSPSAQPPMANTIPARGHVLHKVELRNCLGALPNGVTVKLKVQGIESTTGSEVVFQDVVEEATGLGVDGTLSNDGVMILRGRWCQFSLDTGNFSDQDTFSDTDRCYRSTVTVIDNATGCILGDSFVFLETKSSKRNSKGPDRPVAGERPGAERAAANSKSGGHDPAGSKPAPKSASSKSHKPSGHNDSVPHPKRDDGHRGR